MSSKEQEEFEKHEAIRSKNEQWVRLHDCEALNCQVYPDGTRRRNPDKDEQDTAPNIPPIAKKDAGKKDAQYRRPKFEEYNP